MDSEGPGALADYWYIAAQRGELASRPIRRMLFERPIVLFRGDGGRPAALEDRCAHRNTPLSAGRMAGDAIECPYHGWRYNAAGRCTHIPSLCSNGAVLPGAGVRSFPVVEQDGFVWVYPGEGAPHREPFRFPFLGEPGWHSFTMRTRFEAPVEACLENFLDCPHTAYVHAGWFRKHDARTLTARVRRLQDRAVVEFINEPIAPSVVSRLLFPSREAMQHIDQFILPSVSRVDYRFGEPRPAEAFAPGSRHFIITSQCTPVSASETAVYTVITYRFPPLGRLVRLYFEPLCRRIIRQDLDILRIQSRNVQAFGGAAFHNVRSDVMGPHIRWLRKHAASAAQPSLQATGGAPPVQAPQPQADPPGAPEAAYEVEIAF